MWSVHVCVLVACPTLCDPTDCTSQAPLSTEFSRQEDWCGLTFPYIQGIFLTQGSNPGLLHCRQSLYHLGHKGTMRYYLASKKKKKKRGKFFHVPHCG